MTCTTEKMLFQADRQALLGVLGSLISMFQQLSWLPIFAAASGTNSAALSRRGCVAHLAAQACWGELSSDIPIQRELLVVGRHLDGKEIGFNYHQHASDHTNRASSVTNMHLHDNSGNTDALCAIQIKSSQPL